MKHTFYRQSRWIPLLLLISLCLIATPVVSAANQGRLQKRATATSLNANIYLPTEALKPIFQDQINQQVASLSSGMITNTLSGLPSADQSWAKAMANALIQPSATLTQLTPQKDGLVTSVNLSLYPGDPKPTNASMLVTFGVRDASTIQVSGQSIPGNPQLANGPLTTFTVPIGQLKSISTALNCGDAALDANIQLPITFNTSQTSTQSQSAPVARAANQTLADMQQPQIAYTTQNKAANTLDAYAEVPNSSLSTLGSSIGSFPISNTWTAQNLRIKTQNNGLVITSDISLWGTGVVLATATTHVQPSAEGGKLVMHVTSTTLSVFIFSFANNSYNQQIENLLNSNLGNALAGKFTVNSVSVGGGQALPCAGSDSLILKGTTSIS